MALLSVAEVLSMPRFTFSGTGSGAVAGIGPRIQGRAVSPFVFGAVLDSAGGHRGPSARGSQLRVSALVAPPDRPHRCLRVCAYCGQLACKVCAGGATKLVPKAKVVQEKLTPC